MCFLIKDMVDILLLFNANLEGLCRLTRLGIIKSGFSFGVAFRNATCKSRLVIVMLNLRCSDRVLAVKVFADGSLKIRGAVQSRQRTRLDGEPPQRDGFEQDYRGAREIELLMYCPSDELGILRGNFASEVGGNIYSKATTKWYR